MSKFVIMTRYVCAYGKDGCHFDMGGGRLVAINPEHVVKVFPRKAPERDNMVHSSPHFCEIITCNGGSELVEGDFLDIVGQLSHPQQTP